MTRAAAHCLLVACAALAIGAGAARAEQRFEHEAGAFAFVLGDEWVKDMSGDGLGVKCGPEACGDEDVWCEAEASQELPDGTREGFLGLPAETFDKAFRQSGGQGAAFVPTVPYERRTLGANDAFYGEYDLKIEGSDIVLKVLRLQSFNKKRVVDLSCMAKADRLPMIRKVVERFELPS